MTGREPIRPLNPVTYSTTLLCPAVTAPFALTGVLLAAVFLIGCSGSGDLAKLDAGLRTELDQMDGETEVECLIGLSTPSPADARDQLEDAGLQVRTVAGDVVTASGTAKAIHRATRFAWVVSIEPSRVRLPSASG